MRKRGFTLIELSIVIVVIGLIIGGVLVGRDLIRAAEIRGIIKQIEQYDTAVYTFKLKYNCLPGDCPNATTFSSGFTNGNGNGTMCPPTNPADVASFGPYYDNTNPLNSECVEFWHQLSAMNLISDTILSYATGPHNGLGDDYPALKYGGKSTNGTKTALWILHPDVHPTTQAGKHGYFLTGQLSSDTGGSATLSPMDAYLIDSKIDDGISNVTVSTKVTAEGDFIADPYMLQHTPSEGASGEEGCLLSDGSYKYNIANTNRTSSDLCALVIRAGF